MISSAKHARIVCNKHNIRIELVDPNTAAYILARVDGLWLVNHVLVASGNLALPVVRSAYCLLRNRGYTTELDEVLQFPKALKYLADSLSNTKTDTDVTIQQHIKILLHAVACSWVDIGTKLEVGKLLSWMHDKQERGFGINGFRVMSVAEYNTLKDAIKVKDTQILQLLCRVDELQKRLEHTRTFVSVGG